MNGYCTLSIKGEKVGIKFSMPAYEMIDAKSKILYEKNSSGVMYSQMGVAYIAYAGYYINCLRKEEDIKFHYEDFIDEIEEKGMKKGFQKELAHMVKVYEDSIKALVEKYSADKEKDEDEEKKTK